MCVYLQNITQGLGPYGNIAPIGSDPFAVIDPRGRDAARRLMQRKEGETLRDNLNLLLPRYDVHMYSMIYVVSGGCWHIWKGHKIIWTVSISLSD